MKSPRSKRGSASSSRRLDRFPHFRIPEDATGVVVYVDASLLAIQMDDPVPGLEAWDNQVDFHAEDFATATEILRVLSPPPDEGA